MLPALTMTILDREIAELPRGQFRIDRIERQDLNVLVTLRARERDGHTDVYLVRLDCTDYPERAPDAQFLNPHTLQPDSACWPRDYVRQMNGMGTSSIFRHSSPNFICTPSLLGWQRPGGHPLPSSDQWKLECGLRDLFLGLNAPEYAGRTG